MKYIGMTLRYLKKNILWRLFALTIIPAIAISFTSSMTTIAKYFVSFNSYDRSSFSAVFSGISEINVRHLPLLFISLVLFSVVCAIVVGIINTHMHTGTFNQKGIFTYLNENFLPCIFIMAVVMASITLMGIFVALFIYLWSFLFNDLAALILSLFSTLILFIILLLVFSFLSLACPAMVVSGKNVRTAVSSSVFHAKKKISSIFFAILLPLLPAFALIYGFSFLSLPFYFYNIIDTVVMVLLLIYYPSLMFVVYYDIFDIERADLSNPFNW